jgi:hypothetical protein
MSSLRTYSKTQQTTSIFNLNAMKYIFVTLSALLFLSFKAISQGHIVYAEFVDTVETYYTTGYIIQEGVIAPKLDSAGVDSVSVIKLYILKEDKKIYLEGLERIMYLNPKPEGAIYRKTKHLWLYKSSTGF